MALVEQLQPARSNGSVCGWKLLLARLPIDGEPGDVETLTGWMELARTGTGMRYNQISAALAREAAKRNAPWMRLGESTVRRHGRGGCVTCQQP